MIRRSFRIGLTLGILGGLAFALTKMLSSRSHPHSEPQPTPTTPWPPLREEPAARVADPEPEPEPEPVPAPPPEPVADAVLAAPEPSPTPVRRTPLKAAPAKKVTKAKKAAKAGATTPRAAWVEPSGDVCPTTHPVKAKLSSKIFHLPGMLNYERTKPDRCYLDAGSAESDGLRAAKR